MFFMQRVSDGSDEFRVAKWAAAVFGRTGAFSTEAAWQRCGHLTGGHLVLYLDEVLPAVAEVVLVNAA